MVREVPDIEHAIRETGVEPRPRRLLRRAGWVYLAALHLLAGLLLIDPGALQRARQFWSHDPSVTDGYQGMVLAHQAICDALPDRAVVFLGDSRLRRLFIHETGTGGAPAISLSIIGDTTKGLLGRVAGYRHLERASRLVVGTGINDLSHFREDAVAEYYRQVLALLTRLGPRVTVIAVYPINERLYEQGNAVAVTGLKLTNQRILAVNERIRAACRQFSNVDYLDANAALIGEDGNLLPTFSDDGLHLNDTGNKAWGVGLRSLLSGA